MKLSVIIPVYKAEATIRRCLDSLLNQPHNDVEIIVINDGSPDTSGDICQEYAKKYSEIRYVEKENGGVSTARNMGLDLATGDYVVFVDSDDWVYDNFFSTIENNLSKNDWDLFQYSQNYTDGKEEKPRIQGNFKSDNHKIIFDKLIEGMCHKHINKPIDKVYKRSIIEENNLRFHKDLCVGEDRTFNIAFSLHVKKWCIIPDLIYWVSLENGEYWRMYVLIENALSYERIDAHSAYLAGQAFGHFQCQLSTINCELVETIPDFHNLAFRIQQLHEALANDAAGRKAATQDIADYLLERADAMCIAEKLYAEGKLVKRVNHCDTKVNNMLFDQNGQPMCIVDLDTVMPGFVLSDFGDFIRTAANTGAEDDPKLDNIHVNMEIFQAYAKGYLSTATFLTPLEISLLPYGCTRMSFMQAVRFYVDYLNGDTYYQIAYPEHNLVRTKAQIRLFEEQENAKLHMQQIIDSFMQ